MGNMSGSYGSHYTLRASGYVLSQNKTANTSTIRVDLWLDFDGSSYYAYTNSTTSGTITINGSSKAFSVSSINFSSGVAASKLLGTYDVTVGHNANGTRAAVAIAGSWNTNTSRIGSGSTSGSVSVPTIPRYLTITSFTVTPIDETSVKFAWKTDATADYAWYSTNNGSTWAALPTTNIVSKLAIGTSYKFKLRLRRKDSGLTTDSSAVTKSTYDYPKLNSAPALSVGDELTIGLYNPLGRTAKCYMVAEDGTEKEIGETTGTTFNGFNDEEWLDYWYNSIPNSTTGKYKVRTICEELSGDNTVIGNDYSIKESECLPIFTGYDYEVIDQRTLELTSGNQTVINGFSNISITIPPSKKATAQNGASMVRYKVTIEDYSVTGEYSETENVVLIIPTPITNSSITVFATDSRGLSKGYTKELDFIPYSNTTITTLNAHRNGGVGKDVFIEFQGKIWGGNFGRVSNTIKNANYLYRVAGGEWIEGTTQLTYTIAENGEYTGQAQLIAGDLGTEGFSVDNSFDIEFEINDELSYKSSTTSFIAGIPAIAIKNNQLALHGSYNDETGGDIQLYGDIMIGLKNIKDMFIEREIPLSIDIDLDNDMETGFYYINSTSQHAPFDGSNWYIMHLKRTEDTATQIAFRYRENEMWIRNKNTVDPAGWKSWVRVAHDNYETSEVAIGTYTNGKTIYRKVFSGTKGSSNKITFGSGISRILRADIWINSDYGQWWKAPCTHSSTAYNLYMYFTNNTITVECGSYYSSGRSYYAILEYTK